MASNVQDLPIGTYNFANATKWLFNIPISQLFKAYNFSFRSQNKNITNYPLNCKSIQFPNFKIGITKVSFLNYTFDVSNRSNQTQKTLTITFLLSNNWIQYLMLLKWFQLQDFTRYNMNRDDTMEIDLGDGIKRTIQTSTYSQFLKTSGANPYYTSQGPMVNCTLYMMDNFLNRVCTFYFEGCFLTDIKNVQLNYGKISNTEQQVTFTMSYYKYNVVANSENMKQFLPYQLLEEGFLDHLSIN